MLFRSQKSGSWFAYKGERLGQGRDNVKEMLKTNDGLRAELEQLVRENMDKLNPSARTAPRAAAPVPVEIPLEAAAKMTAPAAKAKIDISVDD